MNAYHVREDKIADNRPAEHDAQPRQPFRACRCSNHNGERRKQGRRGDPKHDRAHNTGGRVVPRRLFVAKFLMTRKHHVGHSHEQRHREQEARGEDALLRNDAERWKFERQQTQHVEEFDVKRRPADVDVLLQRQLLEENNPDRTECCQPTRRVDEVLG